MRKIMIVDDAAFMRLSIRNMLEKANFEIIAEAADGEEAVELYKTFRPDIVTMDITMPKMSGIESLIEIKKNDSNAKVVMVTAMGQEKLIKESVINGATSFIVKPFKKDKLLEVLNGIVV